MNIINHLIPSRTTIFPIKQWMALNYLDLNRKIKGKYELIKNLVNLQNVCILTTTWEVRKLTLIVVYCNT